MHFIRRIYFVLFSLSLIALTKSTLQVQPSGSVFIKPLGESIVFTCSLVNVEPVGIIVNIQWFGPSGDEIQDKTVGRDGTAYIDKSIPLTNKLYITNIAERHVGTYRCSASLGGNREEINVTLQIFQDITFNNAPNLQTPTVNTDALILCMVSGNPIPNVYWKFRGVRLTSDRYIEDFYGLRIRNITLEDEGLYYCCAEVESSGRYLERQINVIVYIIPKVSIAETQEGIASQEFAFKCNATGKPPPKFEFYMNDNRQPVFSDLRKTIDGDAGLIYYRPLTKEDEATYKCTAFNTAGNDSKPSFLHVIVPPTIYSVKNVTQTENLTTTLICESFGDPPPDMTYRKEGSKVDLVMGLNAGGRITLRNPSSGRLEMEVRNLEPDDTGNYTCKSRNIGGYHEKNGSIIVNYSPRFHPDNPTEVYVWAGKSRNMTCQVLAQPLPVIQWVKWGRILENNETYRIFLMGKNSNLQVTVTQYSEIYVYSAYTCLARNNIGTGSFDIQLKRATLPGPPANVSSTSSPTTIRFYFTPPTDLGGTQLLGYWVQYELKVVEFFLGDNYVIEYLRPSFAYSFMIRARTEVGTSIPALTYSTKTADISSPYPIIITSNPIGEWPYSFYVTWERPETGGYPIREFEFRLRRVNVKPGTHEMTEPIENWTRRIKETDPQALLLYYLLQGLLDASYYQLEIRALNDIGWSLPNPEYVFSTIADPDGSLSSRVALPPRISLTLFCFTISWSSFVLSLCL